VPRVSSVDSPIDAIATRAVQALLAAEPDAGVTALSGDEFDFHARESCGHTA
jgi:hypothetical protein